MIRPYYTVIKDSFHEALVSRVLWILLGLFTVLLAVVAPLGLDETAATRLAPTSVRDWPSLISQIKAQAEADEPAPGRRIWKLADDEFRRTIEEALTTDEGPRLSRESVEALLGGLNEVLARDDFYDAAAWADVSLDEDLREKAAVGGMPSGSDEQIAVNRQLLKRAFPRALAEMPDRQLFATYLGYPLSEPIPMSRAAAQPFLEMAVAGVMQFFVGTLAVFVGVLVTAPMIPRTFEAGAVDLLLSKPVARPALFLAKFLGGCAFILLNAGYFVVGLWLILGLRLNIWENALLLCIPLFMLLFVIYYAVSALAGVVWKNAIVAIVVTIVFWIACTVIESAKDIMERVFLDPSRIVHLVPTDDALVAVNRRGEFLEWRGNRWETILERQGPRGPRFLQGGVRTPIFDRDRGELVYLEASMAQRSFGFVSQGEKLQTARWIEGSWQRTEGPSPPSGTSRIVKSDQGELLAVGAAGVFRLDEEDGDGATLMGIRLPFMGDGPFTALGPAPPLPFGPPVATAVSPDAEIIAVYREGRLVLLRRSAEGLYQRVGETTLEDATSAAVLALTDERLLVAQADGRVVLLDVESLEQVAEFRPAGAAEPYQAIAHPSEGWLVVAFHNGEIAVFDAMDQHTTTLGHDVSAITFDGPNLLVADRADRVRAYSLDPMRDVRAWAPPLDTLGMTYYYFVLPFHTLFPKPSALSEVTNYLLTDQETMALGPPGNSGLDQQRRTIDVEGPIWSSLAFVGVMLAAACLYIQRVDF